MLNKIIFSVPTLFLSLANFANDGPWDEAFERASGDIWAFVGEFLLPFLDLILAVLLVLDIVKAIANHRRGEDVQIIPMLLVIAAIALLAVLGANDCMVLKQLAGLA